MRAEKTRQKRKRLGSAGAMSVLKVSRTGGRVKSYARDREYLSKDKTRPDSPFGVCTVKD